MDCGTRLQQKENSKFVLINQLFILKLGSVESTVEGIEMKGQMKALSWGTYDQIVFHLLNSILVKILALHLNI